MSFEKISVLGNRDNVTSDDDQAFCSIEDGVHDTNDIEPDISLLCKYNTYLVSSGLGQMQATIAYQGDIELLRLHTKAKSPVYLFDQIKACFKTMVHVSKITLLDKSASLSCKSCSQANLQQI
jgi:hypothetical protein